MTGVMLPIEVICGNSKYKLETNFEFFSRKKRLQHQTL